MLQHRFQILLCHKYFKTHEILILNIRTYFYFLMVVRTKTFHHHTSTHTHNNDLPRSLSLLSLNSLNSLFFQYNNLNLFMAGYIFQYFSSYLLMLYIYHVLARTMYYPSFALMLRRNHHS